MTAIFMGGTSPTVPSIWFLKTELQITLKIHMVQKCNEWPVPVNASCGVFPAKNCETQESDLEQLMKKTFQMNCIL